MVPASNTARVPMGSATMSRGPISPDLSRWPTPCWPKGWSRAQDQYIFNDGRPGPKATVLPTVPFIDAMRTTTKALVLSSLKYGDSSLIVRALTESDGLKSYLLKGVLASRKGKLKPAYFQPLMQLEIVANHRNKGHLEHLTEVKLAATYQSLHTEVPKNSVVLFLAEMLSNSTQDEQRDPGLFSYLEYALQWLDGHALSPDFHILFLFNLSKYLGFYPDTPSIGA